MGYNGFCGHCMDQPCSCDTHDHEVYNAIKGVKILGICGSPRSKEDSNTYKAIEKYIQEIKRPEDTFEIVSIPTSFCGCVDCRNPGKLFIPHLLQTWEDVDKDELSIRKESEEMQCSRRNGNEFLWTTTQKILDADKIVLGSPVYLDHPTSQTMAFLSRLTCWVESTNRVYIKNKPVYLVATGFCSGTKTTIGTLFNMCEMLGFTIPGRSSREYIVKWSDKKLRGGLKGEEIYLDDKPAEKPNEKSDHITIFGHDLLLKDLLMKNKGEIKISLGYGSNAVDDIEFVGTISEFLSSANTDADLRRFLNLPVCYIERYRWNGEIIIIEDFGEEMSIVIDVE